MLVRFTPFIQPSGLLLVAWQYWLGDPMFLRKPYSDLVELIEVLVIHVVLEEQLQHGH